MFLAILAEGQVYVRDDEKEIWGKAAAKPKPIPTPYWSDEYGVCSATGRLAMRTLRRVSGKPGNGNPDVVSTEPFKDTTTQAKDSPEFSQIAASEKRSNGVLEPGGPASASSSPVQDDRVYTLEAMARHQQAVSDAMSDVMSELRSMRDELVTLRYANGQAGAPQMPNTAGYSQRPTGVSPSPRLPSSPYPPPPPPPHPPHAPLDRDSDRTNQTRMTV